MDLSSFDHAAHAVSAAGGPPAPRLRHATDHQARIDLAICHRLIDWLGVADLIHAHVSIAVPDEPVRLLQLPFGHLFGEARASDMIVSALDGTILSDPTGLGIDRDGSRMARMLHARVPRARCIIHVRSDATIAVANYRRGLLPLTPQALHLCGQIAYLDHDGLFDGDGAGLGTAIGEVAIVMLRHHGPLLLAPTPWQGFSLLYHLERACRIQIEMLAMCRDPDTELCWPDPARRPSPATAPEDGDMVARREWDALTRMLDDRGADYAS